jgi:hypothetical protein
MMSAMPRRLLPLFAACALAAIGATEPDAATRRWWSHVRVLAADDMEGRDTGSEGYKRPLPTWPRASKLRV